MGWKNNSTKNDSSSFLVLFLSAAFTNKIYRCLWAFYYERSCGFGEQNEVRNVVKADILLSNPSKNSIEILNNKIKSWKFSRSLFNLTFTAMD